jgi:hypothetical protein
LRRTVALLNAQKQALARAYADLAEVKRWAEDLKYSSIAHAVEQAREFPPDSVEAQ